MNQLMAALVADVGRLEESVNSAADARAQQAIANALANGQALIESIKKGAAEQTTLMQKDCDARVAALEADYKAKLAAAKVKT